MAGKSFRKKRGCVVKEEGRTRWSCSEKRLADLQSVNWHRSEEYQKQKLKGQSKQVFCPSVFHHPICLCLCLRLHLCPAIMLRPLLNLSRSTAPLPSTTRLSQVNPLRSIVVSQQQRHASSSSSLPSKIVSAAEAVKGIKSGDVVLSSGFGLCGTPDTLIKAISENKDIQNLTCVSNNAGSGDRGLGE